MIALSIQEHEMKNFLFAIFLLCLPVQIAGAQEDKVLGVVKNAQLVSIDNVEIASRDAGIVVDVKVVAGTQVSSDQVLVTLDFEFNESEVAVSGKELLIAEKDRDNKTDLEFAAKSVAVFGKVLQRSTEAIAKYEKVMSQTELERRQLEFEQAQVAKNQAQHAIEINSFTAALRKEQLEMASLRLRHRRIRSPIAGIAVEVLPQVGEWVGAGEKIARIVNLKKLRVEANVPARLFLGVAIGQSVKFSGKLGDTKMAGSGVISFVSPEIDPVNQDFKVWAEIDNSRGVLHPGIVGQLELLKNAKHAK